MNTENQNIEWKESWRDEYLKWICGFANAQGGVLNIGIDNSGNVVGLKDIKSLLEEIPNKIVALLGIVADVIVWIRMESLILKSLSRNPICPLHIKGFITTVPGVQSRS